MSRSLLNGILQPLETCPIHSYQRNDFNLVLCCIVFLSESVPEPEIAATANASLEDASVPPPEFPDFDIFAPEATDRNAINLAALDVEATEFPGFDSLPPPPLLDEDNSLHLQAVLVQRCPRHFGPKSMQSEDVLCQSSEEMINEGTLASATGSVSSDLGMNGSHTTFNLSSEHSLPSEQV